MRDSFPLIQELIPHRGSMVLIDWVLSATQESLCAQVTITAQNIFFDPQEQMVGAWLGIEYMAQTIAAFEGYQAYRRGEPVKVGFLLGTRRFESHCAGFVDGTVLHIDVHRVLEHENGLGAFDCRITDADSNLLASATVTVYKPDNLHQFLEGSNE